MQRYRDVLLDARGNAIQGASVTVKTYPAGVLATIYSDNGITPAANPLTTDALGVFTFYAADGRYSLDLAGAGIVPQTISDIIVDDPDSHGALTLASLAVSGAAALNTIAAASGVFSGALSANSLSAGSFTGLLNLLAGQVKFPAVANPSADLNTLDQFLEGAWVPRLSFGNDDATYSVQSGAYVKIGRLFVGTFQVTLSGLGSVGGAANVSLTGFPVAPVAPAFCAITDWITLNAGTPLIHIGSGSVINGMIRLRQASAAAVTLSDLTVAHLANTTLRGAAAFLAAA